MGDEDSRRHDAELDLAAEALEARIRQWRHDSNQGIPSWVYREERERWIDEHTETPEDALERYLEENEPQLSDEERQETLSVGRRIIEDAQARALPTYIAPERDLQAEARSRYEFEQVLHERGYSPRDLRPEPSPQISLGDPPLLVDASTAASLRAMRSWPEWAKVPGDIKLIILRALREPDPEGAVMREPAPPPRTAAANAKRHRDAEQLRRKAQRLKDEGRTIREIASAIGRSERQVARLLHRPTP